VSEAGGAFFGTRTPFDNHPKELIMAKVIAVTNQKGGVGKTTSSINLAASLALRGRRVLLLDSDPQGNATMGSGIAKNQQAVTINEVLLNEVELPKVVLSTPGGYDLAPANSDLTAAEVSLLQRPRREYQLLQAISRIKGSYDYLILDCPPSLNMLTVNALVAADSVVVPVQCEYYALEGLTGLVNTITSIKGSINTKLIIEGVLRTMYDGRNRLATEVSAQLLTHFGSQVFATIIPRNVRLAEAPSFGLPAVLYDKTSPGALAYLALADEVLARRDREFTPASVKHEPIGSDQQ
jgi:chromosome partitioning protein